jgi:hypothetical protein
VNLSRGLDDKTMVSVNWEVFGWGEELEGEGLLDSMMRSTQEQRSGKRACDAGRGGWYQVVLSVQCAGKVEFPES